MSVGRATGDAGRLALALRAIGVTCEVEPRAALAILRPIADGYAALLTAATRLDVVALARGHGFTHVAVELDSGRAQPRAAVLRD